MARTRKNSGGGRGGGGGWVRKESVCFLFILVYPSLFFLSFCRRMATKL